MKRFITCDPCGKNWSIGPRHTKDEFGIGEHVRIKLGLLNSDCKCDDCGTELPEDYLGYAISIHKTGDPAVDLKWEADYMKIWVPV